MRTTALAVLAATLISTASAGIYYIDNYCTMDMYLISTSTPAQPTVAELVRLPANTTNAYSEVMRDAGKSSTPSECFTSHILTLHSRPPHQTLFPPSPSHTNQPPYI
jgi:hypothetical protein